MAAVPDDVASLWKSLDPAVRAALIESESKSDDKTKEGLQGRRAKASTGPRMDDTSANLIGGDSFTKRSVNPGWIKVRADVYDAVKERRDKELAGKVPVDIEVTLPDGKVLSEDKVRVMQIQIGLTLSRTMLLFKPTNTTLIST